MTTNLSLKEQIAPHFWKTFFSKKPHQIDKGGRGSTKTSKNALKIVCHCINESKCSAIVIRKTQNTLRDSVYKEIKRALGRIGAIEELDYKSYVSPMKIVLNNGNTIYFAGLDDYEKIKGFIDETRPIKIVWFEEITEFKNEEELQQVNATFSRGNNDWFITLYSFNPPKNKFDWVNEWADKCKNQEGYIVTESDYRTVPEQWLGKMFLQEAERMLKYDEKRYRWIYLGEVIGLEGLIYNYDLFETVPSNYIEENKLRILYIDFAIDSGHQTSATSCGAYGYASDGKWYRLDTYYYSPNEKPTKKSPSELSHDLFEFRRYVCTKYKSQVDKETIDSAEGALRNQYFKDFGITLHPVNKGKDKEELIDYSQDFVSLRKYVIIDNSNNKIHLKELKEYKWLKDSVEKGKPVPDKTEKEFKSEELYYNSHSKSYSYYYADHSVDEFQYFVKDNLQKLGLKF